MTVFIQKGDVPMSVRQAIKRGLRHFNSDKAQWERETGIVMSDPGYLAWAAQWLDDNQINEANNFFNYQLAAYRSAVARLAQYKVSLGRTEERELQGTGEFDTETGEEIMVEVVTISAIEPLDATIEQPVTDPETGEVTGSEIVPNPLIVADEYERAYAEAVIMNTPHQVKEFD